MAITEKQRIARAKGVGSSDIGAIMGFNPYRTAHDVWLEKTGRVEGFEGNAHTVRGEILEPAILKLAELDIGHRIVAPKSPFVRGLNRANVDGMIERYAKGQPIVEAKSSLVSDGWGEPGTDEVPHHVHLQVMHQMLCAESDFAYVVRLGGFYKLDIYHIEFDRDIAEAIENATDAFWNNHVVPDIAPPIDDASRGTLAYYGGLERDNDLHAPVDPKLCYDYVIADREEKEAKKRKDLAKTQIMAALGDASNGDVEGYKVKVTSCKGRKSIDTKALEAECPDIAEKYTKCGPVWSRTTIKPV